MESLITHEESFGLPTTKYFLSANLKWTQSSALPCLYNYRDVRFNHSVIPDKKNGIGNWLQNTLYTYSRRNGSTILIFHTK